MNTSRTTSSYKIHSKKRVSTRWDRKGQKGIRICHLFQNFFSKQKLSQYMIHSHFRHLSWNYVIWNYLLISFWVKILESIISGKVRQRPCSHGSDDQAAELKWDLTPQLLVHVLLNSDFHWIMFSYRSHVTQMQAELCR